MEIFFYMKKLLKIKWKKNKMIAFLLIFTFLKIAVVANIWFWQYWTINSQPD